VVFELSPPSSGSGAWTETVLYSFIGGVGDGEDPVAGLIFDSAGNLYGTTLYGSTSGYGTVFELAVSSVTFNMNASPTTIMIGPGYSVSSTISIMALNGFDSAVTLSVSGLPSGVTASFSTNPIPAPGTGTSTMTISVPSGTALGAYPFTVIGTGGGVTQIVQMMLHVIAELVHNEGFEAGSFLDWTAGGTGIAPAISTAEAHRGHYSALLGASSGTEPNGTSWISQTISIPSKVTTAYLTYWYWPVCNDTITNAYQEAQIQNSSGKTLAQVMTVCSNAQSWLNQVYDLTPYIGQTIQVYFDDYENGASGKLTYMYLDDVAAIVY
jgi:uncharacterized repeat protein (TIGR03803 family)